MKGWHCLIIPPKAEPAPGGKGVKPTAGNRNSTSQIIHRPYRTVGSLRGRFYRSTTGGFARCRLSLRRSFLAAGFDGIPGGFGGAFGGGELLG